MMLGAHIQLESLTVHWLQSNFVRASAVLHVATLEGSHTGALIPERLKDMLVRTLEN